MQTSVKYYKDDPLCLTCTSLELANGSCSFFYLLKIHKDSYFNLFPIFPHFSISLQKLETFISHHILSRVIANYDSLIKTIFEPSIFSVITYFRDFGIPTELFHSFLNHVIHPCKEFKANDSSYCFSTQGLA